MTTTKPRKITATAENGEVFTRKTARTYTHAVYLEVIYSDGRVINYEPNWAGRPDLAEKSLKQNAKASARMQGSEVWACDQESGSFYPTGIFKEKVRAVCVPVNA